MTTHLKVGDEMFGWGADVSLLAEDPKGYGPRVLSLETAKKLIGELDAIGWEGLREARVFQVYALADGGRRPVLVGDMQFPLQVWQRPVAGDVPSEQEQPTSALAEILKARETIVAQEAVIKDLRTVVESLRTGVVPEDKPVELVELVPAPELETFPAEDHGPSAFGKLLRERISGESAPEPPKDPEAA